MNVFEKFKELQIDDDLICLERPTEMMSYFCYPVNAQAIGLEGCILYCFLPEYGEMVFAVNPESSADAYVYPLAKNFVDFMRLILACGTANPIEQIIWMSRERFEKHMREACAMQTEAQKAALYRIAKVLELLPMEDPFGYVKEVQRDFDGSGVRYSDEYYEVLGLERESLLVSATAE